LTKLTEEGPFASETEFSRLDFGTWVSQDSTSTISPATVVKGWYADLDKPIDKVTKEKNHGFGGSYSENLSSSEIQTETFKGLMMSSLDQIAEHDDAISQPSLNDLQARRVQITGVYPPGFNEYEDGRRSSPAPPTQGRQQRGVLQKNNRKFNEAWSNEQDQGTGYMHFDHVGSSGPARRVMDFFRRMARDRGQ
jgi:hypothetical protein